MKKLLAVLALTIFTFGFVSCDDEAKTDQNLYENSGDKDEEPDRDM